MIERKKNMHELIKKAQPLACQEWKAIDQIWNMKFQGIWRRQHPHYAGEIWKRSFISTVRPTVHTNPSRKRSFSKTLFKPEKFENAALFLRIGLPSTLIRHEIGAFRKRSSLRSNLKTPAFRFRVDGKHFENADFLKRWHYDNHGNSITVISSNTNTNSWGVVWTENIWCVFRVSLLRFQIPLTQCERGVICIGQNIIVRQSVIFRQHTD